MLIIGADDENLRLACEACGAHAIRPASFRFWALRCHVCGEIGEIHGPRARMSASRSASLIGEGTLAHALASVAAEGPLERRN